MDSGGKDGKGREMREISSDRKAQRNMNKTLSGSGEWKEKGKKEITGGAMQ